MGDQGALDIDDIPVFKVLAAMAISQIISSVALSALHVLSVPNQALWLIGCNLELFDAGLLAD